MTSVVFNGNSNANMNSERPPGLEISRKSTIAFPVLPFDILGESAFLPGSNDENQALEQDLITEKRKLLKFQQEAGDIEQRTNLLYRNLNSMKLEVNETQNLLRAKTMSLEAEQNLLQLTKAQVEQDRKQFKLNENKLKEAKNNFEITKAKLDKQTKALENLKDNKRMDHEQFQSIVDEIVDADDLNVTIQKFLIVDERTATELNVKLEKWNEQLAAKKMQLQNLQAEIKSLDMGISKANADFTKDQNERNRLLAQWEQAIGLMHDRDADTENMRKKVQEYRHVERQISATSVGSVAEARQREVSRAELHRKIEKLDFSLAKIRAELSRREADLQQGQAELVTAKALLNTERSAVDSENSQIAQLKEQVDEENKKLAKLNDLKHAKQNQLAQAKAQVESAEGRKARINREVLEERERQEMLAKQKRQLQTQLLKKKDQINTAKQKQKELQEQFEEMKLSHQAYANKLKKLEHEGGKHKEDIEARELEIRRLEQEIAFADPNALNASSIDDESKLLALKKRFETEQHVLVEKEAAEQTWLSTIKMCQSEIEKAKKELDKISVAKSGVDDENSVLQSEIQILDKRLKAVVDEKQETLVHAHMLKAEINRLQSILDSRSTEVANAEHEKSNIATESRSQQQQLKSRKQELQTLCMQAEEERKRLNARLNDAHSKIVAVKNRYDGYIRGVQSADELSQKQAQEKAELQATYDDLYSKVQKMEEEVAALENMQRLVTVRNQTFRHAVMQADKNTPEFQEKLDLERKYEHLNNKYRETRQRIKKLHDKNQFDKHKSIEMERNLIQADIEIKRYEEESERLKSEIEEQKSKLERWHTQNERAQGDFQRSASARKKTFLEDDIALRSYIFTNSAVNKALNELTRDQPDIESFVSDFCLQNGLELETSSESGAGSAMTRSSTVPKRGVKNGQAPMVIARKNLDISALPPIAPKAKKTNTSSPKIRTQSLNRQVKRSGPQALS